MLALDFAERVAEGFQEIVVGGADGAVQVELDHGLRPAERVGERLVRGILEKLEHEEPHPDRGEIMRLSAKPFPSLVARVLG